MAKNISSKKPLSIKLSSHANNKTNTITPKRINIPTIHNITFFFINAKHLLFKIYHKKKEITLIIYIFI